MQNCVTNNNIKYLCVFFIFFNDNTYMYMYTKRRYKGTSGI